MGYQYMYLFKDWKCVVEDKRLLNLLSSSASFSFCSKCDTFENFHSIERSKHQSINSSFDTKIPICVRNLITEGMPTKRCLDIFLQSKGKKAAVQICNYIIFIFAYINCQYGTSFNLENCLIFRHRNI